MNAKGGEMDANKKKINETAKVLLSRVLLLEEPSSQNPNKNFLRFAIVIADGTKVLFLHNQKVYSYNSVLDCNEEKHRLICEYYLDEEKHNAIQSQKLSHFIACDAVQNKEIYENCAYLPELMVQQKTLDKMKQSVMLLKNRDAVSLQELLSYERFLVCLQHHGKVAEQQKHDEFYAKPKKHNNEFSR